MFVTLTPGQQGEATVFDTLLKHVQGKACLADTGYDADRIRDALLKKNIQDVIGNNPVRTQKRACDQTLYRHRYKIECCFHSLKRFRAIATRYDKSATCFLASVHVGCILLWLP